jgi:hypothetical protein
LLEWAGWSWFPFPGDAFPARELIGANAVIAGADPNRLGLVNIKHSNDTT